VTCARKRCLFVTRQLTPSARHRLLRITRGRPHLRNCAEIMEHLYALCDPALLDTDRPGHAADTAPLGETVAVDWRHLQKVFSPHLEKSPDVS